MGWVWSDELAAAAENDESIPQQFLDMWRTTPMALRDPGGSDLVFLARRLAGVGDPEESEAQQDAPEG